MTKDAALRDLRAVLRGLPEGAASQASRPPAEDEIFTPDKHGDALDADRVLVVGNRGVGKSFWSSVLADSKLRELVGKDYPRLRLDQMDVELGFHEDAGKVEGPAPSPDSLGQFIARGHEPKAIWRAVLLHALRGRVGLQLPAGMTALLDWSKQHIEEAEAALRRVDAEYVASGRRFVLVFDALDRLGADWAAVRQLTEGLLRLALDVRGFRALRLKVFMRPDQAKDDALFRFPDASKLRVPQVDLVWRRRDLFGLLYSTLWRKPQANSAFRVLVQGAWPSLPAVAAALPAELKGDEEAQEAVFNEFAGQYMGSNPRRGKTYAWLHDHLADADGETSPRSFLVALKTAAVAAPDQAGTVIDHAGIREGVQAASTVRVLQLKEDYGWIQEALAAVRGLEVPCTPQTFLARWKEHGTIQRIRHQMEASRRLGPVEIEGVTVDGESELLLALQNIGIIERRAADRINVPDIFRVAAALKRRGGVKPPSPAGRR